MYLNYILLKYKEYFARNVRI